VRVASLLWKNTSKVKPDFYGFEIPLDEFVVGRGLDYKGLFRTLINVYSIEKNELL
jgi:hypoxanthine-guanine phosphoribosyltransferase